MEWRNEDNPKYNIPLSKSLVGVGVPGVWMDRWHFKITSDHLIKSVWTSSKYLFLLFASWLYSIILILHSKYLFSFLTWLIKLLFIFNLSTKQQFHCNFETSLQFRLQWAISTMPESSTLLVIVEDLSGHTCPALLIFCKKWMSCSYILRILFYFESTKRYLLM